ncbi:zinc-dependent alcohol dehydrogenase [Dokdonella soli]|uniref:zinc-dependent alcohol dehydrogenase n=1 Tax=Dokdonella soli TaxID=529810 RepID=UPI0031D1D426
MLVRIRATGICGTDLGIVRGEYQARPGVVLGHESAGEVARVGRAVRAVRPGDRVVIDPTFFCGYCRMCRSLRPNHCESKAERESGVSQDGTFAHYYCTDERFVHRIADQVSFAEASLTEPLSCALTGLEQLRLRADMDTVVAGAGPMGMLYCYALAARGFVGTMIEQSTGRLALCRRLLPSGWQISPTPDEVADSLDLVVDTTGAATSWALRSLRRGGQLLTIGLNSTRCELQPALLADRSLSIVGSIDSIGTFSLARMMIDTGSIPAQQLVTNELPLDQYEQGFALLGMDLHKRQRSLGEIRALKVVLTS